MPKILADILIMPRAAQLIFLASTGALAFAFVMQFEFGVEPCILCLWQRVPFGAALVLALTALLWKPYGRHTRIFLALCAAVFFINTGLALFHTGVERHWWLGTSGCAITPLHGAAPEDLRAQLLRTVVARCDEISWVFLGLSMANWNIPFSLGLTLFSTGAALNRNARGR
jgi:disulfide bond formation protein DsbB